MKKIQFSCDHFIGTPKDFKFNPNVSKYREKYIELGTQHEINNKYIIFCYTHILDNIETLILTLKFFKNSFILVFHNSDGIFNKSHLRLFDELPSLQNIYTQNMNVIHNKVVPLPIGFANSQWPHGNQKIHNDIYNMNISKTKNIYFNFSIDTNRELRNDCYQQIIKKNIPWVQKKII